MIVVLVVGSTGKLGRAIVRRLRADGVVVRAMVRPASDVAVLRDSGAELVVGDLRNAESLRRACQGCDAVVTTASSLHTSTGFDPEWTDRNGNLNLIEAARQESVGHVVFTSTIGANALDAPRVFRNKRLIEERLAASGLRHTILRPAGFMESLVPLIPWARRAGVVIIPRPGTTKTSYIAIRDIAEMARLVVVSPPRQDSVIEFGGPQDLSILDCVALLQEALGRRLHVWRVPLTPLRCVGRVARSFNQALDAMLEIVEFVEQKGLRADKAFLSNYPLTLTSFRSFLYEQLERK
jgi:NADH dehydrogenase